MNLTAHIGDTRTFTIPLRWLNRPFVPGNEWHLVFTAKLDPTDDDGDAKIQLESGNGVTATGSFAIVSVARSLTVDQDPATLYWDVQAEKLDSEEVKTVRTGRLILMAAPTRGRRSAIGSGLFLLDDEGNGVFDELNAPLTYT